MTRMASDQDARSTKHQAQARSTAPKPNTTKHTSRVHAASLGFEPSSYFFGKCLLKVNTEKSSDFFCASSLLVDFGVGGVNVNTTASGASVLATNLNTPVVTKTTVGSDLLHALKVTTEGGVEGIGRKVDVLASFVILLPTVQDT